MSDARTTADAVVIGGGINGAAISFHLAKAGLKVVVLEASRPGAGASSRGAGIIRTYHHLEAEAALAIRSLQTFRNWKHEIGGSGGYRGTGFLWMIEPDAVERAREHVAALVRLGASAELVSPSEIESMQAHISAADVGAAIYEPHGGFGDPMAATASLHAAAAHHGAELINGTSVTSLISQSGRIAGVMTCTDTISAPIVVLAAGAWSVDLAKSVRVEIPVVPTRMTTGTIWHSAFRMPPMTFIDTVSDTFFRPSSEPGLAHISIRDARHNTAASPTSAWQAEAISPSATAEAIDRLSRRIPDLRAEAGGAWAGVDGVTADYRAIYGAVPRVDGLYLCVAGNFKGFKVAPAAGANLAQLIVTGRSEIDLADFRLDRFASAAAPQSPPKYALSAVA